MASIVFACSFFNDLYKKELYMQKYDTYLVLCLHPSALIPQPSAFIHQRDKHRNLLVISKNNVKLTKDYCCFKKIVVTSQPNIHANTYLSWQQ